ncbi:sugar nucleotide-binding protein [Patescibacteria group bacterium]|nr:sugar nucleotide-binding protein [Patescibacteria group bacterium]
MPESSNLTRPRVAILGVTGMIGSAIYGALKDACSLVITYRNPEKLDLLYRRYGRSVDCVALPVNFDDWQAEYQTGFAGQSFSPLADKLRQELSGCDWVINAMGITKAVADINPTTTLFVNGAIPHILAEMFGAKLIHITTDCVFDGTQGAPYSEDSPKRPVDLYGLSKMIGEPKNALVLRCSTIGPELETKHGLLEWYLSQSGEIKGFINHWWNGITATELGRICLKLIVGGVAHPGAGTYHIFSSDINKDQLLRLFSHVFGKTVEISSVTAPVAIDRRLASNHSFCRQLNLLSIDKMVAELADLKTASLITR